MQKPRRNRPLQLAALLAVMALSLPLVAGFLGSLHPALDSFSHFRAHLAVLVLLLGLLLLFGAFRREGVVAIAFGAAALFTVAGAAALPGLGRVHAAFEPRDEVVPIYRLLQFNLRYDNREVDKVLAMIGSLRPDIITLQEAEGPIRRKLAVLDEAYPYKAACRGSDVVILSLRPFAEGSAPNCLERTSFASARIDLAGRVIEVAALHLHWPWPFGQSRDVERLREPLAALAPDAMVAGDFNAVPWSAAVRRIEAAAGAVRVAGDGATWMLRAVPDLLRPLGLPIDHVLAKGDIVVHSARTLAPAGSDHLPVLVEFSLRAPLVPAGGDGTTADVKPRTAAAG